MSRKRYSVTTRVEFVEFWDVVTADSEEEARERAEEAISLALGDNYYEINYDPTVQEIR